MARAEQGRISGRPAGLARYLPEPSKFWIAHAPRRWRAASGPWTDLASGCLRGLGNKSAGDRQMPRFRADGIDGVLYLPPVAPELTAQRAAGLRELGESGISVLVQLEPGEGIEPAAALGVYDLLPTLLADDLEALGTLPSGANAVWPLIPGWTDAPDLWQEGCDRLAGAGVACVQPLAVELTAADRRRLAELGDDAKFDALFHGETPSERAFSRRASSLGLGAFLERPELGATPRQIRNQRLAAELALAGELWLRLERSVSTGNGLLLAAREAAATHHDLTALVSEGNLSVLPWLNAEAAELIREVVARDRSSLVRSLMAHYLAA